VKFIYKKGEIIKTYDVIVLGAGASALMLVSQLCKQGFNNVLVLEHNAEVGMKIKVSGGGKCNVTNEKVDENNYLGDNTFVKTVLDAYSPAELLAFLKAEGVEPKVRSLGQYFCKKSADEVINVFKKKSECVKIVLNEKVLEVTKEEFFTVKTQGRTFQAKKLVIATGSPAYPQVGGSDIGLSLATSLGHTYEKFVPALVGWTVQKDQFWMKELSGISTPVSIDVGHKKLPGELLFAHKGISGPAVLSASLYWKKGMVEIDFLPDTSLKQALSQKNKQVSTQLGLSKRLAKALLEAVDVQDKVLNKLSQKEWDKLALIKAYPLSPAGNFGLKKAEACRGGVNTSELNAKTMQSKFDENLYFIGEVVDVTGELGGYNFQWAFASAVVCAQNLIRQSNDTEF
jgi:predicted Rossmann fold flavoprotein